MQHVPQTPRAWNPWEDENRKRVLVTPDHGPILWRWPDL